MNTELIILSDIVEENGKTVRENNLTKKHNIPIGTLVEVKFDEWFGDGACWKVHARLWVVLHGRDCDGTPLYSLSQWREPEDAKRFKNLHGAFSEENLTVIEIIEKLCKGHGALEWE